VLANPPKVGVLVAVIVVGGVATAVLLAVDADLATAALTFLGLVVVAAGFGWAFGGFAVVLAYLALNLWFTDPTGTLSVDKVEDLVPLAAFALAAVACARRSPRLDLQPLGAVTAVGIVTAVLVATDADLVTASLVLLGVVTVTAVFGVGSAVTAVVAGYLALNFWFTPPIGSLEITKGDDLVPLIAFVLAAAMAVATVARINWLRQRAAIVEQREFDARLARATSDERAMFLATMTHNLRTPLATIRASISALMASPDGDTERRRSLLANARAETDRLDRLVTKVLEMSRIHAGALEPSRELVELGELAGRAVRRLHDLAGAAQVCVAVTADDLVMASVDPDMIELVVIVMLENALRFAPSHSRIDVLVERSRLDALVKVVDHGPGIPVEHREAVFDEFVRIDREHSGSSGLGLTIARTMIRAHGGEIWVEETPGGGATVVTSVPAEPTATGPA